MNIIKRYISLLAFVLITTSSIAQYELRGSASVIQGDTFSLTPAIPDQVGAVWYKIQHNLNDYFTVSGKMNFGSNDGGADGLVFVMQDNCLVDGGNGGGMGYEDMPGKSVAVEFDIFENGVNWDEPFDHLALTRNGNTKHIGADNLAGPVQIHGTKDNIEDGIWYDYQINFDPVTNIFEVYFDGDLRLTHFIDLKNEVFDGDDYVYWGFTAGTGPIFAPLSVSIEGANFSIKDDTICNGSTTVELPELDPSLQYAWSPNDGSIDDTTSSSPTFTPTQTTTYTVTIPNECADPLDFEYTVYVNNESNMRANASDTSICKGDSVQILGSGGFNYQWSDNLEDGDKVALNSSKTFYLIGENEFGCFQADTVRVEVLEPIIADFDFTVNADGSISFTNNSSNANIFYWEMGNGDTLYEESPIYSYAEQGTYNVILFARSDGFACEDSISKEVIAPCKVSIPTAFTPDNDLTNDTWNLGCFDNPDASVRVFNRWGALVYESKGGVDFTPWDGKGLGGSELPVGTYYYTMEGVNQDGVNNNGIVTIIR